MAVPQRSLVLFAPRRTSAPPRPGVGHPVPPAGMSLRRRQDLPSSWRTPIVRLRLFHTDAGRTAGTRPLQCRGVALGDRTAKAPARGLSTLPSMASGLAVYASPDRLPGLDAKLASSRWSDATGRALHPQGPNRRFQSACIISSSFSKLAWRNRCVLCAERFDTNSLGPAPVRYTSPGIRNYTPTTWPAVGVSPPFAIAQRTARG